MSTRIHKINVTDLTNFTLSDPEGVIIIMPCTDTEMGMKTAEVLLRRAGMDCAILIINDTLRQGYVKTLNQTAAKITAKYIVYLAQDAWPGRGWLKCAYDTLEKSGKGLLAFNDGKWHGRIASFGMVRTSWIKTLYGGDVFYPGYYSHAADKELTVIADTLELLDYNPECTLMEHDLNKDFGGSNPADESLFKKRFVQGFDGLAPLNKLQQLAQEYKVKWQTPGVSIIITVSNSDSLEKFLETFTRTNTFHPVELIILDHALSKETTKAIANYSTKVIIRHIIIPEDQQIKANNLYAWKTGVEKARYLYLLLLGEIVEYKNDLLLASLKELENPETGLILLNADDIENTNSKLPFTTINREQLSDELSYQGFICRKSDFSTSNVKRAGMNDNSIEWLVKNMCNKIEADIKIIN